MKKPRPARWTVQTKHIEYLDKTKSRAVKVESTLFADGTAVHALTGPLSEKTLTDYAELMNKRKAPAPKPTLKTRMEGALKPVNSIPRGFA